MKKKPIILLTIAAVIFATVSVSYKFYTENQDTLTELISAQRDPYIEKKISSMTLEEKIGQMFMGCFYNGTPSPEEVSRYSLGGVLLFRNSFENSTPESVRSDIGDINSSCDIRPFFAVDEEGGTVTRISCFPEFRSKPFSSPRDLYETGGIQAIISDTHEKNLLLSEIGINLNLAPVCDISMNQNDFMYLRSLGQNASITSLYAASVVEACLEDNMGCCLKHFPGYGNSSDTHNGISVDNRSLKQLKENDILPFEAGIKAGAPAILVSHNIVSAIDDTMPASLSASVHKLLRHELGFNGVVITDDMSMGAISGFIPEKESAVTAVTAGNDILCTGNFKEQSEAVISAVRNGIIPEKRIDDSVRRILSWKKDMSLF